jgi:ATP/maltotriose-dependent transcriptional regulator MalT
VQNRSRYQQNIIKNYYENRDDIMWQRLSELVTELYLAEGKKRTQLWKRAAGALEKMGVKQDRIDHIVASDNPQLLAKFVEQKMD